MNVVDLYNMDCRDAMSLFLPDNSVDAIVCDPPYGLSFMGKKWDYDVPGVDIWAECLRVLKPGGHLLAFAGTRTQHRMAVRIEDAGFEIRDMIAWVYGSGFNKVGYIKDGGGQHVRKGWGGSLKPALEPITVARKPLIGTVAANVLAHGTGALNIDGCRVGDFQNTTPSGVDRRNAKLAELGYRPGEYQMGDKVPDTPPGRWPANIIHDGSSDVVAAFPDSNGSGPARKLNRSAKPEQQGWGMNTTASDVASLRDAGTGSAARFFYAAKASKKDRDDGNGHPTVKPTDLMAYLCRLVTPPGGVVFDPFMGSGSTGKAAIREGFGFIGCEMDAAYFAIAQARLAAVKAAA